MKKFLAFSAAMIAAASVFTGCGNKTDDLADKSGHYDSYNDRSDVDSDMSKGKDKVEDYAHDAIDGAENAADDIIGGVGDAANDIVDGLDGDSSGNSDDHDRETATNNTTAATEIATD